MSYTVEFSPAADRQFGRLDKQTQARVLGAIESLQADPRPRGAIRMRGPQGYYRIRVGNFRVIYQVVDDRLLVLVLTIAHRKDAYRDY